MIEKLFWAAVGGVAVYWWIKRSCPCNAHDDPTEPVAQQSSLTSDEPMAFGLSFLSDQSAGDLFDDTSDDFAASSASSGCSSCAGASAPMFGVEDVYLESSDTPTLIATGAAPATASISTAPAPRTFNVATATSFLSSPRVSSMTSDLRTTYPVLRR